MQNWWIVHYCGHGGKDRNGNFTHHLFHSKKPLARSRPIIDISPVQSWINGEAKHPAARGGDYKRARRRRGSGKQCRFWKLLDLTSEIHWTKLNKIMETDFRDTLQIFPSFITITKAQGSITNLSSLPPSFQAHGGSQQADSGAQNCLWGNLDQMAADFESKDCVRPQPHSPFCHERGGWAFDLEQQHPSIASRAYIQNWCRNYIWKLRE
jgi:hypothetical protein